MKTLELTIERTVEGYRIGGINGSQLPTAEMALALIRSAMEQLELPSPIDLAQSYTSELTHLETLDDEALGATAELMLTPHQQRRFCALLRKEAAGALDKRERAEWEELRREFLRVSVLKTKALAILEQRKARAEEEIR